MINFHLLARPKNEKSEHFPQFNYRAKLLYRMSHYKFTETDRLKRVYYSSLYLGAWQAVEKSL